ncbi:MAG: TPM domain-containing protein, partial [Oscillospiraceae bacterium]|nr:TPM domain-containing protein [Oscillospiraceae bacterium]
DRDYALIAYGDFANTAFTDYGKDLISEAFLDNFRRNDWYGGFYDYLDECEYQLKEAKAGNTVDIWIPDDPGVQPYPTVEVKPTFMDYVSRYLFGLIPGSIISLITCAILRSKSKTVRIATDANRYVENGLQLRVANEMFLHRSQTRRVIEQSDRGSHLGGGGHMGGTTIHSSGFSGKSGKF